MLEIVELKAGVVVSKLTGNRIGRKPAAPTTPTDPPPSTGGGGTTPPGGDTGGGTTPDPTAGGTTVGGHAFLAKVTRRRDPILASTAAGKSYGLIWGQIWGGTGMAGQCGQSATAFASPTGDRFAAGNRLKGTCELTAWPAINVHQYTYPVFVVDTSKPQGPVSAGGGGYTWQKIYNRKESWFGWDYSRENKLYREMTETVAVPIGFSPAYGTDGAASIIDVNPASRTSRGFWILRQVLPAGTTIDATLAKLLGGNQTIGAPYPYTYGSVKDWLGQTVPVNAWTYITCALTPDYHTTNGVHYWGSETASGIQGAGLIISQYEALLAVGKMWDASGTIVDRPGGPLESAIQHMLGIEVNPSFYEGVWWAFAGMAKQTDANHGDQFPYLYGLMQGQCLYLDPAYLADPGYAALSPLAKAICWAMCRYGAVVTDMSGNTAIRGEWENPDNARVWPAVFGANGKDPRYTMNEILWKYLYATDAKVDRVAFKVTGSHIAPADGVASAVPA